MEEKITLKDYLMGRVELYPSDYSDQIEQNALKLLNKVNNLLNDLGIEQVKVSSGWRPPSINGKLTNAAKKSYHMLGIAVDISDDDNQNLGKLISSRTDLLKKYDLWIEDLEATRGQYSNWVHIDMGVRQDRPSRMFQP